MSTEPRQKRSHRGPLTRGGGPPEGDDPPEAVQRRAVYQVKAEFFRILGHPVRVRILELLREGERTVSDLQVELQMDSSGTSQHLGVLRKQGMVEGRREGTSVHYSVRDPRVFQLLEVARQILNSNLAESQAILGELAPPR